MAFKQIPFFCSTKKIIKSDGSRSVLPGTWKPSHNNTTSLFPKTPLQEEQVTASRMSLLLKPSTHSTCYPGSAGDFNATIFSVCWTITWARPCPCSLGLEVQPLGTSNLLPSAMKSQAVCVSNKPRQSAKATRGKHVGDEQLMRIRYYW